MWVNIQLDREKALEEALTGSSSDNNNWSQTFLAWYGHWLPIPSSTTMQKVEGMDVQTYVQIWLVVYNWTFIGCLMASADPPLAGLAAFIVATLAVLDIYLVEHHVIESVDNLSIAQSSPWSIKLGW
jgi:hypothetical protein